MMEPLKITFKLASPLFLDSEYPIHLDALLAFAYSKDAEAMGEPNGWDSDYLNEAMESCLQKTDPNLKGEWVWKASRLLIHQVSELMFANQIRKSEPEKILKNFFCEENPDGIIVKRFMKDGTPAKINPSTMKINTLSGQQRGYQWLAASRWVDEVTAYAVGDKEAIEYMLNNHIKFIGKVGRNGYGRIHSISVDPFEGDPDSWMLRTLPHGFNGKSGELYAPVQACIRFPYWRKTDKVMALEWVG